MRQNSNMFRYQKGTKMQLTKGQVEAVDGIADFLSGEGGIYYFAGYAGTGKSHTLAEATRIGVIPASTPEFPVAWCAPSWKAALVLRTKGRLSGDRSLLAASSFHAVVYGAPVRERQCTECGLWEREGASSLDPCRHNWASALRFDLDGPGDKDTSGGLLIVDESSMMTRKMLSDAQGRGWSHVLLIGDSYQLPPPTPSAPELRSVLAGRTPDIELTEVMRTALDSPILRLATDVRENGWVRLPPNHPLLTKTGGKADVVLVGTHATRIKMNGLVRKAQGLTVMSLPRAGEPLISCANYKDLGIFNKSELRVVEDGVAVTKDSWEATVEWPEHESDKMRRDKLIFHRNGLTDPYAHKSPEWSGPAVGDRRLRVWGGHASTVHSSQGSDWSSVGLINEASMFRQDASRWLYVAVTRASQNLWVLQ